MLLRTHTAAWYAVATILSVLVYWGMLRLAYRAWRRGMRLRRPRSPAASPNSWLARGADAAHPRQRATTAGADRCAWHKDKRPFATEGEAQEFIDWTRRRFAAGTWRGKPMDHAYRCPVVASHWHVSSQPRRP